MIRMTTYLLIPIVFLVGAVAGGLLAWHIRGRMDRKGGSGRFQTAMLVVATALFTTLLLAAVGYGLLRVGFKKSRMSPASAKKASVAQIARFCVDFHRLWCVIFCEYVNGLPTNDRGFMDVNVVPGSDTGERLAQREPACATVRA